MHWMMQVIKAPDCSSRTKSTALKSSGYNIGTVAAPSGKSNPKDRVFFWQMSKAQVPSNGIYTVSGVSVTDGVTMSTNANKRINYGSGCYPVSRLRFVPPLRAAPPSHCPCSRVHVHACMIRHDHRVCTAAFWCGRACCCVNGAHQRQPHPCAPVRTRAAASGVDTNTRP